MGLIGWIAGCVSSTDASLASNCEASSSGADRAFNTMDHDSFGSGSIGGDHSMGVSGVGWGGDGIGSSTSCNDSHGGGTSWEGLSPSVLEERGFNPDTGLLTMGDRFGVDTDGNWPGTGGLTDQNDHFGSGSSSLDSGWSSGSIFGGSDW
jgi:hypothetical protein